MNVNTVKMEEYAQFLQDHSSNIISLCDSLGEKLTIAVQCMDQQSGRGAAVRMAENLEEIKSNVPISEDSSKRLRLAKKYLDDAGRIFGR